MNELPKEEVVVTYDYRDEQGNLLYQVQRTNHKNFWYRRQDSKGGWVNNIQGVRRVLYRLPELLAADPTEPIFVPEGEKDVDNIREGLGLIAITNPLGAATGKAKNKWRPEYTEALRGRHVAILADNDPEGRNHAHNVAQAVYGIAVNVKIIFLPNLPDKGDVSDWIAGGGTREELLNLAKIAPEWKPTDHRQEETKKKHTENKSSDSTQQIKAEEESPTNNKDESLAESLVRIIQEQNVTLFHDQFGDANIALHNEKNEVITIHSRSFELWAARLAWQKMNSQTLSRETISRVTQVLEGLARYEGRQINLEVRIAKHDGAYWYDLGDGRAVRYSEEGWSNEENHPILFKRFKHQAIQVAPQEGGNILELLPLLNLSSKQNENLSDTTILFLVWLISAFIPGFPHLIGVLHGQEGSGKTTKAKAAKLLIDPSVLEVLDIPKSKIELVQMLSHHWFIPLDNLSRLSEEHSNLLCRACTGQGVPKRALFTDDDDVIYKFRRVLMLTGITNMVEKSDLLDRSILLSIDRIKSYRQETELWQEFENKRGLFLGDIFARVSQAMREVVSMKDVNERMADAVVWGCAIARTFGIQDEYFLKVFNRNISLRHEEAVEANPVAFTVRNILEATSQTIIEETPTDLFKLLKEKAKDLGLETRSNWPKEPNSLWKELKKGKTNLGHFGIHISHQRTNKTRIIKIEKIPDAAVTPVTNDGNDSSDTLLPKFSEGLHAPCQHAKWEPAKDIPNLSTCSICGSGWLFRKPNFT